MRASIIFLALSLAGCAVAPPSGDGADAPDVVIPRDGKADDFLGASVFEYVVEGRTTVTLEEDLLDASEEDREARLEELISLKHTALAYFLTSYLLEKDPQDRNRGWGGMGGMAKAGSYQEMDIEQLDDLTFEFTFQQIVAAKEDLLGHLPLGEGELAADEVSVIIGRPTNEELGMLETDEEWFRDAPWKNWNPDRVEDESLKEELVLRFRREAESNDAWFDYEQLFEDDRLTIDIHFGYDYISQYHRKHARLLYLWLKNEQEFESPITRFDQLDRTTAPFTKNILVGDREVEIAVRIFYGRDGSDTDPNTDAGGRQLEADMRDSFRESDVVLYVGHSGPFYGFSLANWKRTSEGDISYRELEGLELSGRYQVIYAEGCDTYQMSSAFTRNEGSNDAENIDLITTTAYSDADYPYSVMNFLAHVTELDADGHHRPRTLRSLLIDLTEANVQNPLYGIHFVDDNPTLHPYADLEWSCEPCDYHYQCGAPGNRCVMLPGADYGACASACTSDDECPRGYGCEQVAASNAIYDHACVPRDLSCG